MEMLYGDMSNAEGGLRLYDLTTKKSSTLIQQTGPPPPENDELPPSWSLDALTGTYTLARPSWSADGQYVAFLEAKYEGASVGIWDNKTQTYHSTALSGGYQELQWSPSGQTLLKPAAGAYEGTGLFVADAATATEPVNIAERFSKGSASFHAAVFSPDGTDIAFTFNEPEQSKELMLGMAHADGNRFQQIAETVQPSPIVYAPDGKSLYFLKKNSTRYVLMRYDRALQQVQPIGILPEEYDLWSGARWTVEGYLTLVGSRADKSFAGKDMRLLLLDIERQRIIAASRPMQFASFIGFLP